jgi:glycosyltransferase involved in cell wall biosynthesis
MNILTVHNKYRIRGGEDESREAEDRLLAENGHEVREVVLDNKVISSANHWMIGIQASWSSASYSIIESELKRWRPDIVDIHNFFPIGSPSIHWAVRKLGIPIVQTLHNYRLLCPGAYFYRNGQVCEDCVKWKLPVPAIMHGCYRDSKVQTGAVALMVGVHRIVGTWQRKVSVFVAVSEFAKQKFVEGGFPESRIVVKPNFVHSAGLPGRGGERFVCVSRLTLEKGIRTLLKAMDLTSSEVRLDIVGQGPLASEVQYAAAHDPRIRYLGVLPQRKVLDLMGEAKCLIFPSEWYETFGRVAIEAYSRGTPVIASRLGAIAEVVEDSRTGFHFEPGKADDLARVIDVAQRSTSQLSSMRLEVRREYELKYTAERNYRQLMSIYERAIANP